MKNIRKKTIFRLFLLFIVVDIVIPCFFVWGIRSDIMLDKITFDESRYIAEQETSASLILYGYDECNFCEKAKIALNVLGMKNMKKVYYVTVKDSHENITYTGEQLKWLDEKITEYDLSASFSVPLLVCFQKGNVIESYAGLSNIGKEWKLEHGMKNDADIYDIYSVFFEI